MSDDIWKRDEPESPCVNVCVVHPDARLCTGCLRSIDEITNWRTMTPEARRVVMDDLPTRAPLIAKRRGGRKARVSQT
ncbi:DUF1289 domain-containing protein [Aliiroseovarius subalbicans]|uniref:DUF1289 domain-containing protein n=1 Tax=Aliiroseovarius subalbicans TaxID=2925840 RepID=UPI001F58F81D|nr:DUF1289 domain-containing protein [Aliiroseovarius subalbicans]MCI2398698.1 DUF1289 domain-containing protein [Aliiroseovarius subalbicans]